MWWPKTRRQEELVALAGELGARFAARAAGHDRDGTFPHENFADLHASGYLALSIPREFGGGGASYLELALAQERLARGDASTALGAGRHLSILGRLGWAVLTGAKGEAGGEAGGWTPERYATVARAVVEEGALLNSAASEPEMGSPSRGGRPATTASPDGTPLGQAAHFVITGRKTYTTMAPGLRFFLVSATLDGPEGPEAAQFLLERGLPGLSVEETWDAVGMRASGSHDLVLEAVRAPADSLLSRRPYRPAGGPGEGQAAQPAPSEGAGWGALIPAVYLGLATAAREEAVRFAARRKPGPLGGQAIGELPAVQRLLGEIEVALAESRALLFGTTEAWLEAPQRRAELQPLLGAAKYVVTNRAVEVTDRAMRILGGAGLSRSQPVQRHYRDARAGLHHPPMDDVALAALARGALATVAEETSAVPGGA
ncbi:MAG TPA: acyl-CoA dehydrogenase family protein [Chloroflexota bacterium]|nr:acyl-CoA dehydrogenase family protein [Chloroflexota bacterium]